MSDGGREGVHPNPGPKGAAPARAYLGVGSNIEPRRNVIRALQMLAAAQNVRLTGISTFYWTPALPSPDLREPAHEGPAPGTSDPDFLNGVLEIQTSLEPSALEALLSRVEEALGRIRTSDKYAPRTMDLDLLVYVGEEDPGLWPPPHADVLARAWVALPLLELAPELRLPPEGRALSELAASFPGPGGRGEDDLTHDLRTRFLTDETSNENPGPEPA